MLDSPSFDSHVEHFALSLLYNHASVFLCLLVERVCSCFDKLLINTFLVNTERLAKLPLF